MITPDMTFPNNIASLMSTRLATLDSDVFVIKRPLRNTDPTQSIGVVANSWIPDADSLEVKGTFTGQEPTISRYAVSVQAFVKDMDEVKGLATHATLSRMIRSMLYRDYPLAVGLRALSVSSGALTERTMRWGISNQRYFNNQLDAAWLYLSTLEFWLETETV